MKRLMCDLCGKEINGYALYRPSVALSESFRATLRIEHSRVTTADLGEADVCEACCNKAALSLAGRG